MRQYAVYRSETANVDTSDAGNLIAVTETALPRFTDTDFDPGTTYYYMVTALDRLHDESPASNTASTLPPQVRCPAGQNGLLDAAGTFTLPDFRAALLLSGTATLTQVPAPGTLLRKTGPVPVTIRAVDKGGNTSECSFLVQVSAPERKK